MKKVLYRFIACLFLLLPISCCLSKIYTNKWMHLALLMSFAIGLAFVNLKGE